MTDSRLFARGEKILKSTDGPSDGKSFIGNDIISATVDLEEINLANPCFSNAKSRSTRNGKGVLHFALKRVQAEKIPSFVKERDTSLTFPEKLMLLLAYVERTSTMKGKEVREDSIGWSPDGTAIVIRDKEHLSKTWLPLFFGDVKFSSFTRKLYRWGFRKMYPTGSKQQDNEATIHFVNGNFHRDEIALLSKMKSATAQKDRARIAGYSAASCNDKEENGDAPQKAPDSSPLVHGSSFPDVSQQLTTQQLTTQQVLQRNPNDKPQVHVSSFPSLNEIHVGGVLHNQDSAMPTANFVDRPSQSQLQALQLSALIPGIPGNRQHFEPAALLRLSTSQSPDHVQSTELNFVQLLQEFQNYNSTINNSLNSSLMQGGSPSTLRQEIRHMSPLTLLPTSEQSPEQVLARSLNLLRGSWQGATSSSTWTPSQPMAKLAMSNMSVASPVLSILDSLLQQQQQQGESNHRFLNPQVNMAFPSRTAQSLLSEQEQLDALAEWIRRNQGHFT